MWYHHYYHWPFGLGFGWGFFIFVFPYFLPTIVAVVRRKSNAVGIFFLNLFLGWTVIGWIGALIWALGTDRVPAPTVIVNNPPPPPPPTTHTTHSYTNVTLRKPMSQQDKIDQLRQLKQLLDEGVLTEAEFNRQKAEILG